MVIDTGEVPPGERFDLWADATPRVFEPLAVAPRGDTPFEGRVARHPLGPLTLYRLRADPSMVTRTRAMIGASDPEWVQVSLLLAGRCVVEQDGRRSVLSAGDFASWASSRPYAVDAHTQHDLLVTYCPEPLLRASRIAGRTATTISGAQGAGPLLRRYLRTLVRGHIDEHLGDPALDPESIAAAHFISRRHLDRLFADGERTVAETIRDRRLERCRRDLEDPARAGDSVLDIAMRWGFVSPAHFSRAFRATYGMTPRELRQTKMRPPSTTIV